MPTLISLCALSKNHWNWSSVTSWKRPGQENWLIPCSISDILKLSFVFWARNERTQARASEQFTRWTSGRSCTMSAGSEGSISTNCRLILFSDPRFRNTSIAALSCGAENAIAPDLKIPALCHAILSIEEPSCLTWSMPSGVIAVTRGFSITFVESYSPPWCVSKIVASTPSLIKAWKDNRAKNWRYRGLVLNSGWDCDKISSTSKKYFANRSLDSGLKLIRICSSG